MRETWLVVVIIAMTVFSASQAVDEVVRWVEEHPEVELILADGRLKVVNLYKVQVLAYIEQGDLEAAAQLPHLVEQVFQPYEDFWARYLGGEQQFIDWMRDTWTTDDERFSVPVSLDFDSLLSETVEKTQALAGRSPQGTWYLVYGPGWTNMGGLGDDLMVVDFYGLPGTDGVEGIRFGLPHELNHQILGPLKVNDPDAGNLLARLMDEGFATFFNYVYWGEQYSPARNIGFTEAEWQWAIDHEQQIRRKFLSDLLSRERAVHDLYTARGLELLPGGPGALGYFIGFRIIEEYVRRNGQESWRDIYDLPIREAFQRSGYGAPEWVEIR